MKEIDFEHIDENFVADCIDALVTDFDNNVDLLDPIGKEKPLVAFDKIVNNTFIDTLLDFSKLVKTDADFDKLFDNFVEKYAPAFYNNRTDKKIALAIGNIILTFNIAAAIYKFDCCIAGANAGQIYYPKNYTHLIDFIDKSPKWQFIIK